MATPLGTISVTIEKAVAQADLKLLGSTVESLIIESTKRSSKSFSPQALLAPKSQERLALNSLQRLLIEKPMHFLTKQVV